MIWQAAKRKLNAFKLHFPRIGGICGPEEFELSSTEIELRPYVEEWEDTRTATLATYRAASAEVARC